MDDPHRILAFCVSSARCISTLLTGLTTVIRDVNERGRDIQGIIKQWLTFVKPNFVKVTYWCCRKSTFHVHIANNRIVRRPATKSCRYHCASWYHEQSCHLYVDLPIFDILLKNPI